MQRSTAQANVARRRRTAEAARRHGSANPRQRRRAAARARWRAERAELDHMRPMIHVVSPGGDATLGALPAAGVGG